MSDTLDLEPGEWKVVSQWHPVEETPPEEADLWLRRNKWVFLGGWDAEEQEWWTANRCYEDMAERINKKHNATFSIPFEPTHWMLAPPPKETTP